LVQVMTLLARVTAIGLQLARHALLDACAGIAGGQRANHHRALHVLLQIVGKRLGRAARRSLTSKYKGFLPPKRLPVHRRWSRTRPPPCRRGRSGRAGAVACL
jgi:hypothetical protein